MFFFFLIGLNTGTSTAEQLEQAKACVPKKLHEFLSRIYNKN